MQKCCEATLNIICDIVGGYYGRFTIEIFDNRKNLICDCHCLSNENTQLSIPNQGEFMIRVKYCSKFGLINPMATCKWIQLYPGCTNTQYFVFNKTNPYQYPKFAKVNFNITDTNYPNLPINEGVLTLWQNM